MTPLRNLKPGQQIQTGTGPAVVHQVRGSLGIPAENLVLEIEGRDGIESLIPMPGSTPFEVVGAQLMITPPPERSPEELARLAEKLLESRDETRRRGGAWHVDRRPW